MEFETLEVLLETTSPTVRLKPADKSNAMTLATVARDPRKPSRGSIRHRSVAWPILAGHARTSRRASTSGCLRVWEPSAGATARRLREKLRRLDRRTCRTPSPSLRTIAGNRYSPPLNGACIGGGVDLVCCADMRYASADAQFQVRKSTSDDADVGTLQRMPKLISEGMARELAYTGAR